MRKSLVGLMAMASMMENDLNVNHQERVIYKTEPIPSYKRKKCKSCSSFSKHTHNCQAKTCWITAKSTACSQYKPRKK